MQPDGIGIPSDEVAHIHAVYGRRSPQRFCFPLMKMVMNSFCRRFFSAFSAAVSFRLCFTMTDTSPFLAQRYKQQVPVR